MLLPAQHTWARSSRRGGAILRYSAIQCKRNIASEIAGHNVAILGGGITGLSAAIDILRQGKPCRITILESQARLGGWITSEFVDVPGGQILFEKGCRTLRPGGAAGLTTLSMIHHLGLEEELVTCSKNSPAAKNRYVYYPDHLVRMPGSLLEVPRLLFREPLGRGIISGILSGAFKPKTRATADASVARVISENLTPKLVNLVSAVLHGIYAGDVHKLSFAALFPQLDYYIRQRGGILRGMLYSMICSWSGRVMLPAQDIQTIQKIQHDWQAQRTKDGSPGGSKRMKALQAARLSSVYSFKKGIQQLPDRMEQMLRKHPQVHIETDCSVYAIRPEESGRQGLLVKTGANGGAERHFSHVISTLPSKTLGNLLYAESDHLDQPTSKINEALASNGTVNVMVVNLWFAEKNLLPVSGFGYLIPKDIAADQNPELGLGVIFDSDALQDQDTVAGTKITVMLGGHHWDGLPDRALPDTAQGVDHAKSLIARHLKITVDPVATCATMRRNCIPQYHPGHLDRMRKLRSALQDKYESRLALAGSSYDGVGVSDCIRSGIFASQGLHLTPENEGKAGGLLKSHTNPDDPAAFALASKKLLTWNFS
jgi:protoporphyrinogen oxidase